MVGQVQDVSFQNRAELDVAHAAGQQHVHLLLRVGADLVGEGAEGEHGAASDGGAGRSAAILRTPRNAEQAAAQGAATTNVVPDSGSSRTVNRALSETVAALRPVRMSV